LEAPLDANVGGVEASGLALLGRDLFENAGELDPALPPQDLTARMLSGASTHETCHQWRHLMVGSDTMLHPWLDESLTNWAGTWVIEQCYGPAISQPWRMDLFAALADKHRPALAMTLAPGAYDDEGYGEMVYARGALLYQRLRGQLGDARFIAALRDWTDEHRFGWAEPQGWDAWFDRHAPPDLAAEIRTRWLKGEGLTPQALMEAAHGR